MPRDSSVALGWFICSGETLRVSRHEAPCAPWLRSPPQRGGGSAAPCWQWYVSCHCWRQGGGEGKQQEHKTQQGAGLGLQKAGGANGHWQHLTEGVGTVPDKACAIRAVCVGPPANLYKRSHCTWFPARTMCCVVSRAAACGFPDQGKKTGRESQIYRF